jgi:hypothetical protein
LSLKLQQYQLSLITFANGAKQFVVQDAFETIKSEAFALA